MISIPVNTFTVGGEEEESKAAHQNGVAPGRIGWFARQTAPGSRSQPSHLPLIKQQAALPTGIQAGTPAFSATPAIPRPLSPKNYPDPLPRLTLSPKLQTRNAWDEEYEKLSAVQKDQKAKPGKPDVGETADALRFGAKINILGLGLLGFYTGLNTIVLPARIDDTVSHALRGSALGLISALGVGIAAIDQPFAGRASDAAPFHDRRRPFVAAGALFTLPGMLLFGLAPTFLILVAGYMLIQTATNIAQAGFQAFIPDLVPKRERGIASGAKNALTVLGAAIGLIGIRLCQHFDLGTGPQLIWLAFLLLIPAALTMLWVPRIPPLPPARRRGGMRRALDPRALHRSIRTAVREHKTFELAVIAQFLFFFGGYPAQRYLVYFLRDRFGTGAEEKASIGMVGAILIATLAAVVAGALSDRIGRVRILQINVVLAAAGLFIVALAPTLLLAAAGGVIVAAGYGGFLAVNWALLSDDVPEAQAAAAFGLANLSTAGAGALSGVFGPMVDLLNATVPGGTWQTTFGLAALIILAALLPLRKVKDTTHRKG